MAKITKIPDEIIQIILQSIYEDKRLIGWARDLTFLRAVEAFPHWIPILLDSCFVNSKGQRTPRYELVWGYRQRVYLDEESGTWQVRDQGWQPRGAKITGWKCRNGEMSHVEVEEKVGVSASVSSFVDSEDHEKVEEYEIGHEKTSNVRTSRKKARKCSFGILRGCFPFL